MPKHEVDWFDFTSHSTSHDLPRTNPYPVITKSDSTCASTAVYTPRRRHFRTTVMPSRCAYTLDAVHTCPCTGSSSVHHYHRSAVWSFRSAFLLDDGFPVYEMRWISCVL